MWIVAEARVLTLFVFMGGLLCVNAATIKQANARQAQPEAADPVSINDKLGFVIQKGTEGANITVMREASGWSVQDGEMTIANDRLNPPGLDAKLRIDRLSLGKDTAIVKVVLTPTKRSSEFVNLLETVDTAVQPNLVDTNGTKYPAVGFIYRDDTTTRLRFTLGSPLKGLVDAPAIGRSRPDRQLTLIFVVNSGIDLKALKIGKVALEDWAEKPRHVEAAPKR